MCTDSGAPILDAETQRLNDGLCERCVDQLLFGRHTVNDDVRDSKGRLIRFGARATRRSMESSLGLARTRER